VLRKHKLPDSDIGRFEVSLFQLATGNTVPTAYWMLLNIWSRPELVERLRAEITPLLVRGENDEVTFDITKMEEQCPLLVSCYRESNRLSNHILCVRKVLEDCTISDSKGNSYLLKKDCVMQVPAAYTHRSEDVWGKDAAEYNPDRFIPTQTKLQRSAYMPFGGGKHLCPGRNFAFAEIMGFVAALVVGFDGLPAEGENAPWKLPREAPSTIFGGVLKPENGGEGFGVQIRRAKGWENAKWKFVC
jgi:cytochrome P450